MPTPRWVRSCVGVCLGLVTFLALGCASGPARERSPADIDVCAADPARCERLCAGCDDREQCFRDAGECHQRAGNAVSNKDTFDPGDWVFLGGCHYQYSDAACTQNPVFLDGDMCLDNVVIGEWTTTPCHDVCFDTRDCDVECRRLGLGAGTCVRLPDYCGPGRSSAYCKCQNGQPPPPMPNPTTAKVGAAC